MRGVTTLGLGALFAFAISDVADAAPWRTRPATARGMMPAYAAQPLTTDTLRPMEHTFLEKASALAREQIQIARLAVSQAASSDVRTFAQELVADHRQISDSVEVLRRKKGALLELPAAAPAFDAYQQLEQKSGADFDREFVRMASQREAAVLSLFEAVIGDATDPDVRELIGGYLPMLREHQNRGTELRKMLD